MKQERAAKHDQADKDGFLQQGTTATQKFYINQDRRIENNKMLRESGKQIAKSLHE